MRDVVIAARGGVVVEVYCEDPGARVILIGWDEVLLASPDAKFVTEAGEGRE
jgi:hypothetical protein